MLAPAEPVKAEEAKPAAADAVAEEAPAQKEEVVEAPAKKEAALEDLLAPAEPVKAEEAKPAAEETVAEEAVVKEEAPLEDLLAPATAPEADKENATAADKAQASDQNEEAVAAVPEPENPAGEAGIVPLPAEGAETVAADADIEIAAKISEVETLERMRRKALEEHGKTSLANARQNMKDGNYTEAERLYKEAIKFIINRPGNEADIEEAEKGEAEAVYRQAMELWKRGAREEALQLARQAREKNHPKAAALIASIQSEIDNPPVPPPPKTAKRWNEKDFKNNRDKIKRQLLRAREYYITGEYDHADEELQKILRDNPYEQDAISMLRRVRDRNYDFASSEFNTTRAGMITEVREAWTPRRYAIDVTDLPDVNASGNVTAGHPTDASGQSPEQTTIEKMQKIQIPEINFRAANINDVVSFFQQASREFDSQEIAPEHRGVNIILKTPAPAAPVEAALDTGDDPFAPVANAGGATGGIPPVTFSARFMSLYDALTYVTELSALKFRVRGNVVMIMPINEADQDMITRSYTVLPSIAERASSVSAALTTSKGDGNTFLNTGDMEDTQPQAGAIDWKQLFTDMGVKWPTGSTVTYLPSINRMRVYNTPENLIEFEKALQDLNVTPRQIEIEARFVEVAQTDLESLGFEWLLTDDWEIAKKKNGNGEHIKINAGTGTTGLRYLSDKSSAAEIAEGGETTVIRDVNDAILSGASVLTNPELSFVLHALSQRANTDLLSAPKVVTMNSQEAIIKVVTEYIYPTSFEIVENDMDSGDNDNVQVTYPSVEPGDFEMREVGVILQVIPEVSEDGQMIYLDLNPQIISDPLWRDYGFDYPMSAGGDGSANLVHLAMEQPLFKVRSIKTKISIYNGATVVMGGMITEQRNEVEDKVPLLGDIPLLGRLFRSNYENSEKRNLLIFVTARMVDPAGRTLKTEAASGVGPDAAAAPQQSASVKP